jgi:hypothetical protein
VGGAQGDAFDGGEIVTARKNTHVEKRRLVKGGQVTGFGRGEDVGETNGFPVTLAVSFEAVQLEENFSAAIWQQVRVLRDDDVSAASARQVRQLSVRLVRGDDDLHGMGGGALGGARGRCERG